MGTSAFSKVRTTLKEKDGVMSIIWIAVGITISIWSATFPFGSLKHPGPALLPLACGVLAIILGYLLLVQSYRKNGERSGQDDKRFFREKKGAGRVFYTVCALLAYVFLFREVGFLVTVVMLMFCLMLAVETKNWKSSIFYALLMGLGLVFIFRILLKTPLPRGYFGI